MGNSWFAAPNGTPSGDGSIGNPWDLDTALGSYNSSGSRVSPPTQIQPGDTLWLRGGNYIPKSDNGFFASLQGSNSAPVTVRNYNGERATILCTTQAFLLYAEGPYVWYWGIEGTCAGGTSRFTNQSGEANPLSYGFEAVAPTTAPAAQGIKFINCVVHDTAQGFSGYDTAPNLECHGCLSYYNGWIGSDRSHGHGFYMHGATGTKDIEQNIIFDNFDEGMQLYGSGGAVEQGLTVRNNTVFNNGSLSGQGYQYNLVLGNGQCFGNIVDANHFFFNPTLTTQGYFNFGQYGGAGLFHDNLFTNNDVVGGTSSLAVEGATKTTVTGNRIYNAPGAAAMLRWAPFAADSPVGTTWDNNQYFGNDVFVDAEYVVDSNFNFSEQNGSFNTFPNWQKATGFDANSSFSPSAPIGQWISVHKNKYEQKRANVMVYNWDLLATADVDLSAILNVGDEFLIQDAQNFYGPPIVSGTYAGGTVSIPLSGTVKAVPLGMATPPHTGLPFGAFVVMAPGSANPIEGVVLTPVSVTVQINSTQQFSAALVGLTGGVAWSATQGTIAISGIYTAPSAPGSYVVTAASTEDPSKSASATVIVTVAPPVPPPGGPAMFNVNDRVEVNTTSLNVRATPDTTSTPIGNVAKPQLGTVVGASNATTGLTQVAFDGSVTGYVLTAQLIASSTPPPTTTTHAAALAWQASPTSGVTSYNVYRGIVGGPYVSVATGVTGLAYVDKSVVAGTQYFYVVTAVSAGGESVYSNEASGTVPGGSTPPPPPPPTAPAPPSGLTVSMS